MVGRQENGLTYEVRKHETRKPPEIVHCDRLKPQTDAQVYRDGQVGARAFRRGMGVDSSPQQLLSRRANGTLVDTGRESSEDEDETTGLVFTRRRPDAAPVRSLHETETDSGVTRVLETLEPNYSSYSSTEEEEEEEAAAICNMY